MGEWIRVSLEAPCLICGKGDWCSRSRDQAYAICRRVGGPNARAKVDRAGAEYWVYRVGEAKPASSPAPPRRPTPDAAPAEHLDLVYSTLLRALPLFAADRAALRERGLSEAAIDANQYRSLPRTGRARLVAALVRRFGETTCLATPGVIARDGNEGRYLTLAGAEGVLIPVRNVVGQIVALKARRRADHGPKYTYLSSSERGGPGPRSPVHVPRRAVGATDVVRVTEGELKADVAEALDPSCRTISIAGVATWRQAIPTLRALGARTCRLAFDADARTNPHVGAALRNVALQLLLEGFALEVETWDSRFKGIDDALAAGAPTTLFAGNAAYAEANRGA